MRCSDNERETLDRRHRRDRRNAEKTRTPRLPPEEDLSSFAATLAFSPFSAVEGQGFGAGGGRVRAVTTDSQPHSRCAESQNGLSLL